MRISDWSSDVCSSDLLDALTNSYLVSDTGFVSLPLIGNIPAKGKTVGELQDQITKILLDQQILRSPSVNVQVTKYRPFYIMGEVAKPGEYPYRPGMTVLTAVSTAGGYTFRADQDRSEEHTSELQSLMRISYAAFCLKNKKHTT